MKLFNPPSIAHLKIWAKDLMEISSLSFIKKTLRRFGFLTTDTNALTVTTLKSTSVIENHLSSVAISLTQDT